ncbi:XRE family transcriptional regulator [Streptomyces sp. WAC05374]|uniref:telomere-associated protein Tap n=1 Tax=Streptomyces sp. WAC05374 TaxID=2487420 RepID=UPI001054EEE9|nr:helix-turn-helix transcriptional regulator [Streptomyces sp. WAC05374]TDF50737.1 XRE family transcriptional regulator [Streptomyces sp. WAC05374]TDF57027.1 XRE family transcriptional regulator [Streptomyces sp. WAC05374]TDF60989.1 XRE family transcriptional regulator [Streptomyces sp. WAC05374]
MPNEQEQLFAAVDALLEQAAQDPLPDPDERKRLREAAGLSQDQIARALSVRRETVTGWETGRTEPRAPKRAAYARLLSGLAERHPAPTARDAAHTPDAAPRAEAAVRTAPAPSAPPAAAPSPTVPAATAPQAAPRAAATPPVAAPDEAPAAPPAQAAAPPAPGAQPTAQPAAQPAPQPHAHPTAQSDARPTAPTAQSDARPAARPTAPTATRQGAPARRQAPPAGVDERFTNGPVAVLDGDGNAYCAGGLVLDCPARDVPALVAWALGEARLGAPRLHRNGKDADPLVVLTEAAAVRLGLPAELTDRRGLRLPEDHKVVRQIKKAKWQLTRRGFGPWAWVYRPAQGSRRVCVQFAVLPWGALDSRAWGDAAGLPPAELADTLATYASRVITPRGTTAVCGLELMSALRPPTRAVYDEAAGAWVSAPGPGSLVEPVDPAPPEAPDEHPVVARLYPRGHRRTPDEVLDEEAYDWIRDPETLTDAECARPFAVGIDVNMAFAAAANRLTVGLGAPVHVTSPVFDRKTPGSWLVDLSAVEVDPRLPSPFTPHGARPEGPAWYATPTVAYAVELGHEVRPAEAYLRPDSGPYLDAWYQRLRDAYLTTMEELGVRAGMPEDAYLAAMEAVDRLKAEDPGRAAVLSAVKSTVKGGIGKLRERPQGAGYRPGERWPALERPTWRPDIRAAVISTARVNMHRKMRRLAEGAGLFPIAVLSDCAVYLSGGPTPLDFLPRTPEGAPLPGGFRLGVSPGMVKHEGTQSLMWAVGLLDEGHNPARHIKGTDAAAGGE